MNNSNEQSKRSHRKDEHLALAKAFYSENTKNSFSEMALVRPTLPETTIDLNNLKTTFLGRNVSAPFFINAMTGGSLKSKQINQDLGALANQFQIPIALGSASILTYEPALLETFTSVRVENPTGVVLANVNPNTPLETVKIIVDAVEPTALQVHVNAVQELVMAEGDRDFHWLDKILQIKEASSVPIIVKEVGFGFDLASLKLLEQNGIQYVDVSGTGGTDFAQIENFRRPGRDYDYLLNELDSIGTSTVQSLLNVQQTTLTYFASGGVKNPLDVLKCLVLGASSVGISNEFLQIYQDTGRAGLQQKLTTWIEQLAGLLAIFGANDLTEVQNIQYRIKNS